MSYLAWLVPIALGMGIVGLMAFLWSMRTGQFDDLDGAAERVLLAEQEDAPLTQASWEDQPSMTRSNRKGLPTDSVRQQEKMRGPRHEKRV